MENRALQDIQPRQGIDSIQWKETLSSGDDINLFRAENSITWKIGGSRNIGGSESHKN